jgi:hypothetical protein
MQQHNAGRKVRQMIGDKWEWNEYGIARHKRHAQADMQAPGMIEYNIVYDNIFHKVYYSIYFKFNIVYYIVYVYDIVYHMPKMV